VIIAAIAGMPVVELRGAIPVGIWMGVPLAKTLALCVLGNMLPIVPLLLGLRLPIVQRLLDKPLTKARKKSDDVLGARAPRLRNVHPQARIGGRRWRRSWACPFPGRARGRAR